MNYQDVVDRLPRFLDRGFVVSLADGKPIHQGDSLLFSGLALYALGKDAGEPIAEAFEKMLRDLDGGSYRHPDLKDEVSLDGLLGMYRGIAKRVTQYGESDRWKEALKDHWGKISIPRVYSLIPETLRAKIFDCTMVFDSRVWDLESQAVSWTSQCRTSFNSAYRIHLNLIALQTMSELGVNVDTRGFADITNGLDMRTIDHFCGREGLLGFVKNFEYNKWQYAHQRCPLWEVPDGAGQEHPALDYLVAFVDYYGSQA